MSASLEHSSYALPVPSLERFEAALADGLAEAVRHADTTLVTLPAPLAPVEAVLFGTATDAVAWAAPGSFELAALGFSRVLEASGTTRFRDVADAGAELLGSTRAIGLLGAAAYAPKLFGGFSFAARPPRSELWRPFGEARFVLPALTYVAEGGAARLVVTALRSELETPRARSAVVDGAVRAFALLERGVPSTPSPLATEVARNERPETEWAALVEAIRSEIAGGNLEKVVLARRFELELGAAPDPANVLARLRQQAPECTRFLVRQSGSTFLGATPEWLARKRGPVLETAAVAGSMSSHDREGAARLFESGKDRAEHAIVLREILRALGPLAANIEHNDPPELYQLRHVLHLRSRVRATLKSAHHLLDVVEKLHPTPAVGGMPQARALEWIETHEPDERGWYAGPVGWFDAAGDGDMAVALRSGVLAGRFAELYGGAGIVDRSSPAAEFAETRWKLAALLGALGIAD
jgi:menaquinone-specific isochorismate synthase